MGSKLRRTSLKVYERGARKIAVLTVTHVPALSQASERCMMGKKARGRDRDRDRDTQTDRQKHRERERESAATKNDEREKGKERERERETKKEEDKGKKTPIHRTAYRRKLLRCFFNLKYFDQHALMGSETRFKLVLFASTARNGGPTPSAPW